VFVGPIMYSGRSVEENDSPRTGVCSIALRQDGARKSAALSLIAFGSGPGKCELQLEYDTYPDGSFFALTFAHLAAMAFRAISRRCSDVIL
jgi:hypothetical protein